MTDAKAMIVAAVITGAFTVAAQIAGFFINTSEDKPATVVSNFVAVYQEVQGILTGSQSRASETQPLDSKPLDAKDFPSGALGDLAKGVSLIDGATWKLELAPGDRTIRINFSLQAEVSGEKTALVTARLIDSNDQVVCTVGANSATSSRNGKIFWDDCHIYNYMVPAGTSIVFRAETKAEGAIPIRVTLNNVYANAY